jgi:hypothetical protein
MVSMMMKTTTKPRMANTASPAANTEQARGGGGVQVWMWLALAVVRARGERLLREGAGMLRAAGFREGLKNLEWGQSFDMRQWVIFLVWGLVFQVRLSIPS